MRQVAIISEPGAQLKMEDTYYYKDIKSDGSQILAGVYDGHGGRQAAEYVRDQLPKLFFRELKKGRNPKQAFQVVYEEISSCLTNQESGTTAVNFYLKDNRLWYANAGDARLIVISNKGVKQFSQDHRLTNPKERERIVAVGGLIAEPYVIKDNLGLMPTRTIGDEYFKKVGIIATPVVGQYKLQLKDYWILAATDGLFDYLDNQEVAKFIVKFNQANKAAASLKQEVLVKRGGRDNLTFILIKNRQL